LWDRLPACQFSHDRLEAYPTYCLGGTTLARVWHVRVLANAATSRTASLYRYRVRPGARLSDRFLDVLELVTSMEGQERQGRGCSAEGRTSAAGKTQRHPEERSARQPIFQENTEARN